MRDKESQLDKLVEKVTKHAELFNPIKKYIKQSQDSRPKSQLVMKAESTIDDLDFPIPTYSAFSI